MCLVFTAVLDKVETLGMGKYIVLLALCFVYIVVISSEIIV